LRKERKRQKLWEESLAVVVKEGEGLEMELEEEERERFDIPFGIAER